MMRLPIAAAQARAAKSAVPSATGQMSSSRLSSVKSAVPPGRPPVAEPVVRPAQARRRRPEPMAGPGLGRHRDADRHARCRLRHRAGDGVRGGAHGDAPAARRQRGRGRGDHDRRRTVGGRAGSGGADQSPRIEQHRDHQGERVQRLAAGRRPEVALGARTVGAGHVERRGHRPARLAPRSRPAARGAAPGSDENRMRAERWVTRASRSSEVAQSGGATTSSRAGGASSCAGAAAAVQAMPRPPLRSPRSARSPRTGALPSCTVPIAAMLTSRSNGDANIAAQARCFRPRTGAPQTQRRS